MKYFTKLLGLTLLLSLQSYAQLAITNGGFRIKFPNAEWTKVEPPAGLTDMLQNAGGKLLFYVESNDSKCFVSRFDYPPRANMSRFVAGFIGGVRKSSAKKGMQIEEHFNEFRGGEWPSYSYDMDVENSFVNTTAIFCAERLYNVQIAGPKATRAQGIKCLDGVTIHEVPMAAASFKRGMEGANRGNDPAYEMGRKIGTVVGFVSVFVVIGLVAMAIGKLAGGGRKRPPPLPPSARSGPPPAPPTT